MLAAAQQGKGSTGHGGFPPFNSTSGAATVFINGIPAHRRGDSWSIHCAGNSCHTGTTSGGSSSVFVEGAQLARVGDAISCGDAVSAGSSNVFAGG